MVVVEVGVEVEAGTGVGWGMIGLRLMVFDFGFRRMCRIIVLAI